MDPQIAIREPALVWRGVVGPEMIFGPGELHLPNETVENGTFVGVNFKFTVVPEPSTLVMACGGLVVCLAMLRRARKRS